MYTLERKRKKQRYLLKVGTKILTLCLLWIVFLRVIDFHLYFEASEKQPQMFFV